MKCLSDVPESEHTNLTVILARVLIESCRAEIEFEGLLETDPAQTQIALALPWVKRDLHSLIVA